MGTGVVKATVSVTVYLRADEAEDFKNATLEQILHEIDEGPWIGGSAVKSEFTEVPTKEDLEAELRAIGNDGSFFDQTDEDYLFGGYN